MATLKITNYLKNLGKSVQYAAAAGFKEKYDTTYTSFEQASTASRVTANAIVNYRQTFKKAHDYLMKSTVYEATSTAFKNAKADLKTGKLWNEDRANKAMFGDEDFDWNFDEDGLDFDNDSDSSLNITDGDRAVAKTVHDASKANADQISDSVLTAAKYNADVTKQTASFMFAQQERLFGNLNNSIMGLGTTMGNMQNFMTTNMQTHIENSTKYFEESTKYQRENNAILKELLDMERERFKVWDTNRQAESKRLDKGAKQDITDILSGGVMDWGAYAKHIAKGFSNQADNMGLGMLSKEMVMGMASNPLQFIPAMLVSQAMGKPLENAIGKFNKTLTGLFNQINADLLRGKNSGGMSEILADIFGVRIANKDKIDTGNYNKGQVPFDGITRKSIVEVIPGYLSRIEALLGGKERLYDFDKGKFISRADIKKERDNFNKSYKDRASSDMKSALNSDFEDIIKSMKLDNNSAEQLRSIIPDVIDTLHASDGSWDAVMEAYGGSRNGKILKHVSKYGKTAKARRTTAVDHADAARSKANALLQMEKSGDSIFHYEDNDSAKFAGSSIIAANAEASKEYHDKSLNLLEKMHNELFLIRTSDFRKSNNMAVNNRLMKIMSIDGDRPQTVKDVVLQENRAKKVIATAAKSSSGSSSTDTGLVDLENLSDADFEKKLNRSMGPTEGKFDDITGAKGIKGKGKALATNWFEVVKNPRLFLAEVITKVDDNLYDFFFNHETGEKDKEGNEIRGFYDKMAYELKTTFNEIKGWIKEKFWEPVVKKGWGKVKDFAKSLGLDWFKDAKDGFSGAATSATRSVSRTIFGERTGAPVASASDMAKMFGLNTGNGLLGAYANGSLSVPETALTTVSKGELIIPSDLNPFNPDRDKADRKKDLQNELRLQRSILTHAEGGNLLDQGKNFAQMVASKVPAEMRNAIRGNSPKEIMGSILEYAVGNMSGKVDGFDGNIAGEAVKATMSSALEKGLDKVEDYSKTLDPEVGKALAGDVAKLRGNTAKFAGRTGFAGAVGALGATAILGPGGLLAGAAIGAATNIIRESDTAKNFLFGKELGDGSRAGGLISRKQQALFKKYMPDLAKGAAAGVIPSLMLGFGPVGAIAIGGAYSLAKNNKTVNEKIFGKTYYDKDGKPIGRKEGMIPKKVQDYVKKNMPKIAGFGGAAALLDPTGMGLLMNFGLGAGLGLLGTSDKFRDMMLGKKNEKGEREGGLVGALKDNVIKPLQSFGRTLYQDFYKFMDYNLFSPLKGTGKLLAQSIVNVGRSMKYGLFNVLEKAFGGPFSALIGKQVSDMLLKPLGRMMGRTFGGVGELAKFVVGTPIRGIGSGLRKFNDWGNRGLIKKGQADHLSAQERLNLMGDQEYSNKERDKMLATSSANDLGELESSLSIMKSQFKIGGGDSRKEIKAIENALKPYMDAGSIKKITRLIYDGDSRGALALVDQLDLDSKSNKKVIDIITKGIERVQIARGKKKFSDEQINNAKAHLKKLNIDPTDRKSLGIALDQVRSERDRAETAERLVGANGEKFTTEEAKNVAEGMQTTNNILTDIRDALIKSEHGGNDKEYYTDQQRMADGVNAVNALNNMDAKSKKLVERNLGHLNITGTDISFITGKKGKANLKALKNLPESMEIDLDKLAKLDDKTIKRYSQLAMVMGPVAIKSIGDPAELAKLTDSSFKSIVTIATYLGERARGTGQVFNFKGNLSDFIKMPNDRIEFLGRLINYGLNPAMWIETAEYAWDKRGLMTSGIYTPHQYAEMLNEMNDKDSKSSLASINAGLNTALSSGGADQASQIFNYKTGRYEPNAASNQRKFDKDGNEVYVSTDGSVNTADTESGRDKKKAEEDKDEKNAERQGSIFSKALGKIKGFGQSMKDGAGAVKEKSQGFLHDIVDSVMGKGGLFGGIGTILGGGMLLSFIAPMLPEIGKILTHTLLPAVGGFLKNTVLPMVLGGLKSAVTGLLGGVVGREEKVKTDENGNPVLDADGNPEMEVSYNPTLEGMLFNGGVLGFLGYKTYKVAKGVYNAGKSIVNGASKLASGVGRGFRFGKNLKDGKKFKDAWQLSKASKGAAELVKDADKAKNLAKAGRFADFKAGFKNSMGLHMESAKNAIKSGANRGLNFAKSKFTPDKVSSFFEKATDVAKNAGTKVMEFLKEILTKGIEKISQYIPKLAEKGTQIAPKIAEVVLAGIKNSAKFAKLVAKASAYVGASMTGIGTIVVALITALDLGYSITRGIESWYNVAEVLADENPPTDDVKWLAGLAAAIDSVLFSVIGPEVFFKVLAYMFGASELLAPLQERAQKALSDYNASNNSKIESIADFNDDVVMEGQGGFFNDVKKTFGFEGAQVKRYAAAPPAQPAPGKPQGAGKNSKATGGGLIGGMGKNLDNLSKQSSGLLGGITSKASELQTAVFGSGKYFKQTDPRYANINFNTSGDSINQTIGDSGCGPVAGANALKALGAGTINPAEASNFAISGGYKGTDTGVAPSFFEGYAASHGATSYSTDARGTINALKSGNPVVLQGESKAGTSSAHPFGSYPHYVTATGYDARTGKVTIQDPESNRDNIQYNIRDVLRNTTTANAFGKGRFGRGKLTQGIRFGRGIESNVPIIWNKLQGLGFGDIHTAAIMGNMAIESGFDPAINEGGGGGGFGLCQWDDRKGDLAEFAQRAGKDPSDLDIQLQFIKYELQGPESAAASEFFAETSDIDNATEIFCRKYERPHMPSANLEGRKQAAREILQSKGTGKVTSIAGGKAGSSGSARKPGLLSPLFDMYNKMKSSLGAVLGIDLGGNMGSVGGIGGVGGAVGNGNTKAASNWADSMVGQQGYGNNGCTTFVNKYLDQAGVKQIDMYVPTAETNAQNSGTPYAFKSASQGGAEGDVVLLNTLKGDAEADHVVIADGKGGYWGNSSSRNEIVKGDIANDFGAENINGYIATGGSGQASVPSGSATRPQSEIVGDSTLDLGTGKRFGRAKGIPKATQIAIEGQESFREQNQAVKQQVRFGRGSDDISSMVPSGNDTSEEIRLLNAIYIELTKITGNTAGIGVLQDNQAKTDAKVTTVQSGLQGAIGTLGNKLNEKINMVSQNIQGQVNQVTKNVSGNTINQLQYLASK